MLRSSRRFGGPIGQLAAAVNRGDAARGAGAAAVAARRLAALDRRAGTGDHCCGWPVAGYRDYLRLLRNRPEARAACRRRSTPGSAQVLTAFDRFRVLCALREGAWGVAGLNPAIERALEAGGPAGAARRMVRGPAGDGDPQRCRPRHLQWRHRHRAAAAASGRHPAGEPAAQPTPSAASYFRRRTARATAAVSVSRLAHVETAFAMTVHKAQGSEFEHTVLVLPDAPSRVLTRELVYTAITRAREAFTLVSGRPACSAMRWRSARCGRAACSNGSTPAEAGRDYRSSV